MDFQPINIFTFHEPNTKQSNTNNTSEFSLSENDKENQNLPLQKKEADNQKRFVSNSFSINISKKLIEKIKNVWQFFCNTLFNLGCFLGGIGNAILKKFKGINFTGINIAPQFNFILKQEVWVEETENYTGQIKNQFGFQYKRNCKKSAEQVSNLRRSNSSPIIYREQLVY